MSNEPHVTALDLDLVALGQASPEHIARIEAHSGACPPCATRRAEHREHVRHFLTSVFPRTVEKVAARQPPVRRWPWLFGLAVPVAACVLLLAGVFNPAGEERPIGIKGASVKVFARRNRPNAPEVVKVNEGDRLAAGDALRFLLLPTGLRYVLVASVDGAGKASLYYPFQGEASLEVDPQGTVWLPDSIVLDSAPGPERIFVFRSEQPLAARTVREALLKIGAGGPRTIREARQLAIPGAVQWSLLFEKEEVR